MITMTMTKASREETDKKKGSKKEKNKNKTKTEDSQKIWSDKDNPNKTEITNKGTKKGWECTTK